MMKTFKFIFLLMLPLLSACAVDLNGSKPVYAPAQVTISSNSLLVNVSVSTAVPATASTSPLVAAGAGVYPVGGLGAMATPFPNAGTGIAATVVSLPASASTPAPITDATQAHTSVISVNLGSQSLSSLACSVNSPFAGTTCDLNGFAISSNAFVSGSLSINVKSLSKKVTSVTTSNALPVMNLKIKQAVDTNGSPIGSDSYLYYTVYHNRLMLYAYNTSNAAKLYGFDGSTSYQISNTFGSATQNEFPIPHAVFNNKLIFSSYLNGFGSKLYEYDDVAGTITRLSKLSNSDTQNDNVDIPGVVCNGAYYFAGTNASFNYKLYKYDGTTITQVSNVNGASSDSPRNLLCMGTKLYYQGFTTANGFRVTMYDTVANTITQISNIVAGAAGDTPQNLMVYNNKLFFTASPAAGVSKLYSFDGANVNQITNTRANAAADDAPSNFAIYNNKLYFSAKNNLGASKLFVYDDALGTVTELSNIRQNRMAHDSPSWMTVAGSALYFSALNPQGAVKFYQYDDSTNVITQITNLRGDSSLNDISLSSAPFFTLYNGRVYFWGQQNNGVLKLHVYDPVVKAAALVFNPTSLVVNDGGGTILVLHNRLYFASGNSNSSSSQTYWKLFDVCDPGAGCTD